MSKTITVKVDQGHKLPVKVGGPHKDKTKYTRKKKHKGVQDETDKR